MSVVADIAQVPAGIVKPFMSPKTLLIGAGVTLGTLAILSYLLPGLGVLGGLRPQPVLPMLSDKLAIWPFVPGNSAMNGGGAAASPSSSSGPSQEELGRAIVASSVNTAQGYVNSMLQVI